jgi:hypothetical protein
VARKSIKTLEDKKETPTKFVGFLKDKIGPTSFQFLEKLALSCEVLIFSGVIRNYFINYYGKVRDFDLVINCEEEILENLLKNYPHTKNSFGGYKVNIDTLTVDIWYIHKTWAFTNNKLSPALFPQYTLIKTTFFNFSAIVFDFNNREFLYGKEFMDFLRTGKVDLVLEENPLPQLCIVNTIYYKEKYRLDISKHLEDFCISNFYKYDENEYENIQAKHFGEVKYDYSYIKEYMQIFARDLSTQVFID